MMPATQSGDSDRGDADHRGVEVMAPHGAEEGCVAEGEDASVATLEPVAGGVVGGGHPDDGGVEVGADHGAVGCRVPKSATLPLALASQYPEESWVPAMPVMRYPPGANAGCPSNGAFP